MKTIPQRELRDSVSDVLRRAQRGERFTITVDGGPVAELGPLTPLRRMASATALSRVLVENPVDADWGGEFEQMRAQDVAGARDPRAP